PERHSSLVFPSGRSAHCPASKPRLPVFYSGPSASLSPWSNFPARHSEPELFPVASSHQQRPTQAFPIELLAPCPG
ncbi:hypothetical protein A2U01_0059505, partial [Trifolium medium]|nr:hypothetical protein [Trifolium medium]